MPRAHRPWLHAPLLTIAALAIVFGTLGCGSEHSGTAASPTTVTPRNTVIIEDRTLTPREITVRVGEVVTWENRDIVDHELVGLDPNVIHSGKLSQAQSYSKAFSRPGRYPYYCNIYNEMKGTVVVQ